MLIKRFRFWKTPLLGALLALTLVACDAGAQQNDPLPPTATLAPVVSQTPRFTATPIPSRTPLPTETFTASPTIIPPTPSNTPSPTVTPPILGSINSMQSINVRSGPGVEYETIAVLRPATRVEVIGTNTDQAWLNIRMEDGDEGWVSSNLVRLQPTTTPLPSLTPSPDLTLMAEGTPLPTALFGGGTITPTPPRSISAATPSPVGEGGSDPLATPLNAATAVAGLQLPNIEAINQTATALAGGGIAVINPTLPGLGGPTGGPLPSNNTSTPLPAQGTPVTQQRVDVLAYCDNPSFRSPAPTNLASGSTIDIFWAWFASTRQQVQDHIDAVRYDIRLDGEALQWRQGIQPISEDGGQFVVYWYIASPPLSRGDHEITYSVTWTEAIFDGTNNYGPGTGTPVETGTCRFTVR